MLSKHGFVAPVRGRPVERVDELRKIWESDREWVSRRKFLDRHWGTLPPFELDSLSSVWMNNLVFGCRYPKATIERVKLLADGLTVDNLVDLRVGPKEFVKGSNPDEDDINTESSVPPKVPDPPKSLVGMNPFKKRKMESSTSSQQVPVVEIQDDASGDDEVVEIDSSAVAKKKKKNKQPNESSSHFVNFDCTQGENEYKSQLDCEVSNGNALNNKKKKKNQVVVNCQSITDGVQVGVETPLVSERKQKGKAVDVAPVPKKKFTPIVYDCGDSEDASKIDSQSVTEKEHGLQLQGSLQVKPLNFYFAKKKKKISKQNANLVQRIVLYVFENDGIVDRVKDALFTSFCNSRVQHRCDYELADNQIYCSLFINDVSLAWASGPSRKAAYDDCVVKCFESLVSQNIVVKYLNWDDRKADFDAKSLLNSAETSDAVEQETAENSDETSELGGSNIGLKMMQKMGWVTGQGLGKQKQGRVEPVEAVGNMFRHGLSYTVSRESLRQSGGKSGSQSSLDQNQILDILKDYVTSGSDDPLVFSSDFSSVDRAVIHQATQFFNKRNRGCSLKTKSFGSGADRFLTISNKLSSQDIFYLATHVGQKLGQYQVLSMGAFA